MPSYPLKTERAPCLLPWNLLSAFRSCVGRFLFLFLRDAIGSNGGGRCRSAQLHGLLRIVHLQRGVKIAHACAMLAARAEGRTCDKMVSSAALARPGLAARCTTLAAAAVIGEGKRFSTAAPVMTALQAILSSIRSRALGLSCLCMLR